jgi:hypothetical protein
MRHDREKSTSNSTPVFLRAETTIEIMFAAQPKRHIRQFRELQADLQRRYAPISFRTPRISKGREVQQEMPWFQEIILSKRKTGRGIGMVQLRTVITLVVPWSLSEAFTG